MRTFRQLSVVVVLTLMLTMSTFAGEIGIPGAPLPPDSSSTTPGDIHIPGHSATSTAPADPVTDVALNLLNTMLSIL